MVWAEVLQLVVFVLFKGRLMDSGKPFGKGIYIATFQQYLESTTLHGFQYISYSK